MKIDELIKELKEMKMIAKRAVKIQKANPATRCSWSPNYHGGISSDDAIKLAKE